MRESPFAPAISIAAMDSDLIMLSRLWHSRPRTYDGYMAAAQATDAIAQKTIEKLQLNIPKLRALRRGVIAPFLEIDISEEDFQVFVKGYLEQSDAGKFGEFWTTIRDLFA